jgi:hypothetical protein
MAEDVASAVRQDRLVPNHFDVARAMVTARRGRRDAWDFLRRFTEQWATRLDELSGCGDQELTAAEHRLGLTLPAALREGYALLGRRDDLTSNQDVLLRPDQLYFDETGQAAVGLLEHHYTRLAMPEYPMWAAPQAPPIRWFSGRDVLIRDDSREWMWVAARTSEALQGVRQAIPGDWLIEPAP